HTLDFGKRGIKAGVVNEQGIPVSKIHIQRAPANQCYWSAASKEAVATSAKKGRHAVASDLLEVVPLVDPVRKEVIVESAKNKGIPRDVALELLKQLVESGQVSEIHIPRKGTNAERKYVRNGET